MELLSRFVGIWMMFVFYIAVGVEGVAHGAGCTNDAECTEANNVCTTGSCACSDASFQEDSTTTCTTKIALAGACTASPTGQCADTNAECDAADMICVCTANFFVDKNAVCASQVGLDGTCDDMDTAADQCSTTNTECRADGAGSKCLCITTHYSDGTACQTRIKPNIGCTAGQCVIHATCDITDTNTCVCDAGYTPSPIINPTMCNGVHKVTILTYMYMAPILISMVFLLQ